MTEAAKFIDASVIFLIGKKFFKQWIFRNKLTVPRTKQRGAAQILNLPILALYLYKFTSTFMWTYPWELSSQKCGITYGEKLQTKKNKIRYNNERITIGATVTDRIVTRVIFCITLPVLFLFFLTRSTYFPLLDNLSKN